MAGAGAESESGTEATVLITRLAKQLNSYKICPNKDILVKLLKQAAAAFPEINQSAVLKLTVKPLGDALIRHGLLQHKDKDIRLLVAICFCEILRVLAPDPGFKDAVSRDIFTFFISIFAELDDIASPYFSKRVKVLETVAKLKCCVMMLDIGCDNLVLKMFKIFFSVVSEQHPHCVVSAMSSLMIHILEEKLDEEILGPLIFEEKFSEPLLDVILQNLLKEVQGASPGSFQLAVSIVQNCNQKLEHFICAFLRSCIINIDIIGSKVKESCHEIIVEILHCAPHMLLTVIPSLTNGLMVDQVDVRIKALHLTRKLFALPGHHIAQKYRALFSEFLNRFVDKSSEVRLCALSSAKVFYMHNTSGTEALEVLTALENRLLDFDDRIRTEAVTVVCELASSYLNTFPIELIIRVTERLRDKKVCVRKKTFQKLLELYQEYCRKCASGIMNLSDEFEQIPCKILMLYYDKDCKEFRPQITEVLADDLFPVSLSIKERCSHWISAFSLFEPLHQKAFSSILSQKRRLRHEMQDYLDLRKRKENVGSEGQEKRIKALFRNMSVCFPDPAKAEESFHKLHLAKDNRIFCMLEELLNAEITADAHSTKDDLLRKIKDRNPHFEFLKPLSTKCSLNIFSSQHVACLLDYVSSQKLGNKKLEDSSLQLLLIIIDAFPSLLRGFEKRLLLLISKDIIPFNEQLMHILAREGPCSSIKISDIYSSLERICLQGTRAQAKIAVSVCTAFSVSSEKFSFSKLCKRLVDSLHARQSIPSVLQSLGCIAQHCALTTEAQEIACHILEEIFQIFDVGMPSGQNEFNKTSMWSSPYKWMIYALKALVRSFLPHGRTDVNRRIDYLLDIIVQLLQKGGFSDRSVLCDDEKGEIRLAAAKSVLRLSRKWDLHISPLIFRLTVLMAKDDDPRVCRLFLDKLHKLVKMHLVPSRYACAFAIAAAGPEEDLRENAFKSMEEFLRVYCKAAQLHQSSGKIGNLINHPVYVVVFLLHVVAHNTDFPPAECQDEVYVPIFSPLLFTINALVKANFADYGMDICHSNASSLRMIFTAIRRAEDATDPLVTPKLHLFADFGISVLNALQCKSICMSQNHELIFLPSALYKMGLTEERETCNTALQNNKFDESFIMHLIRGLGVQISQSSTAGQSGKYFHEGSLLAVPNKCPKSSSSLFKRVDNATVSLFKEQQKNQDSYHEPHETQYQNIRARGPTIQAGSLKSGAFELQTEFFIDDECEEVSSGAHKLIPSINTATRRPALAQMEDFSRPLKDNMINKCNSNITNPSLCTKESNGDMCKGTGTKDDKEALILEHMKLQSSTCCLQLGSTDGLDCTKSSCKDSGNPQSLYRCSDHEEYSSFSCEREMLDVSEGNSSKEQNDFCSRKVPSTVNAKKRQNPQKNDVDISASEIINVKEEAIGRRLRRRRV